MLKLPLQNSTALKPLSMRCYLLMQTQTLMYPVKTTAAHPKLVSPLLCHFKIAGCAGIGGVFFGRVERCRDSTAFGQDEECA